MAAKELQIAIEVEQHATAQLQKKLVAMQTQSQEMEALQEDNEDLSAQNKAYRNRLRCAFRSSRFPPLFSRFFSRFFSDQAPDSLVGRHETGLLLVFHWAFCCELTDN